MEILENETITEEIEKVNQLAGTITDEGQVTKLTGFASNWRSMSWPVAKDDSTQDVTKHAHEETSDENPQTRTENILEKVVETQIRK